MSVVQPLHAGIETYHTNIDLDLLVEEDLNTIDAEIEVYIGLDAQGVEAEEVAKKAAEILRQLGYTVTVTAKVISWHYQIPNMDYPIFVVNGIIVGKGELTVNELVDKVLAVLAGLHPSKSGNDVISLHGDRWWPKEAGAVLAAN